MLMFGVFLCSIVLSSALASSIKLYSTEQGPDTVSSATELNVDETLKIQKIEHFNGKWLVPDREFIVCLTDENYAGECIFENDKPSGPNKLYIRLEISKDIPVYFYKIRVLTAEKEESDITEMFIGTSEKSILENGGEAMKQESDGVIHYYWKPERLQLISDYVYLRVEYKADVDELSKFDGMTEIEVIKPERFGDRIAIEKGDEPVAESFKDAQGKCSPMNTTLSSHVADKTTWLGLTYTNTSNPITEDGTLNTVTESTCYNGTTDDDCGAAEAICTVAEVEYYVTENKSDPVESCKPGRGIPVIPSSQMEIRLILEKFPNRNLSVAACHKDKHYFEQTLPGHVYNCRNSLVVLTQDGNLENWDYSQHGTVSMALCKRLPEHYLKSINVHEICSEGQSGLPGGYEGIHLWGCFSSRDCLEYLPYFDNSSDIPTSCTENTNPPQIGLVKLNMAIKEIRVSIQYNKSNENAYAEITTKSTCSDTVQETQGPKTHRISLSEQSTKKFYQLKPFDCNTTNLTIKWPKQIHLTKIQLIEDRQDLEGWAENDIGLKDGGELKLTCQMRGVPHASIGWKCEGAEAEDCGTKEEFSTLDGWTSVLTVNKTDMYTCFDEKDDTKVYPILVAPATKCNTDDIRQSITNGLVKKNVLILVGQPAPITCNEGFEQKVELNCETGGYFNDEPGGMEICQSIMKRQLGELMDIIDKDDVPVEEFIEMSDRILEIADSSKFTDKAEIDTATEILKKITTKVKDDLPALSNVLKSANRMARKAVNGVRTSENVQKCLNVVDKMGNETDKEDLRLADDGLALYSINLGKSSAEDITLASFNGTTLDDLEFYDYNINNTGTRNSISIPKDYANGRVWFTVYGSSMFPSADDIASYIIGATFGTKVDKSFKANVTLKKNYYGAPNSAVCRYWDTKHLKWSSTGVRLVAEYPEYIICETTHLTSFAILMTRDDSFIPKIHKTVLEVISLLGCSVSAVCLLLTIIGLLRFPHIRSLTDSIIHVQFSAALLAALIVFLIFIDFTEKKYKELCLTTGIVLHYLFLAAGCWMFCEAVNMFFTVRSMFTKNNHTILMSGFAWGCPLLMVLFTIITDPTFSSYNYNLYQAGEEPAYCWLSSSALVPWFGAPLILIALINTAIYVLILKFIAQNARTHRITCVSDLRSCFMLLLVFGSTWSFGIFTLVSNKIVYQYLFALGNSFQGFCVFYCYCASKQYVVSAWKSIKEPQTLQEKEVTMESKIVPRTADTPTPSPLPVPTSSRGRASVSSQDNTYATPYATSAMMKVKPMNNNWYMNDDHF